NLSVSHNLAPNQTLEWQLAAKEGSNQRPYTYEPVFPFVTARGDNADVNAKDYAGSVRWNIDFNPEHSLYVQGSAQHFDRQQVWRACDAALAFSPELTRLWQLNPDYAEQVARRAFDPPNSSDPRSEEHTSELQSREKRVCRLLLE